MKENIKLYAPGYYGSFSCIADKCPHSCCIGWEIYIDPLTMKKYQSLDSAYSRKIIESIEGGDEPKFRTCEDGRCSHLDSNGLCKIILDLGEEYLSDICREHPRFYNESSRGIEVGIGMACEVAAQIILSSDSYREFTVIGESSGEAESAEFDALAEVEGILEIIATSPDQSTRLALIYDRYGISPDRLSDTEWRELISDLEYLDPDHKAMFSAYSSAILPPGDNDTLLGRALAYFVYRHCVSAREEADFRASLGLSLFLERLFASMLEREKINEISSASRVARILSEELEYSEENTDAIRLEFCF